MKDKDTKKLETLYEAVDMYGAAGRSTGEEGFDDPRSGEELITIDQLSKIPDNAVVWYPPHGDDYGPFLTGKTLKMYIEAGAPEELPDKLKVAIINAGTSLGIPKDNVIVNVENDIPAIDAVDSEVHSSNPQAIEQLTKFVNNLDKNGIKQYYVSYSNLSNSPENVRTYWGFD